MNNLSWFLYLADVLSNLQVFLFLSGLFVLLAGGFGCLVLWEEYEVRWPMSIVIPLSFLLLLGSIVIPSKETMYAIAASQVGETIIQLEEVQSLGGDVGGLASDTIELLRQNIQEQLTQKPVEAAE